MCDRELVESRKRIGLHAGKYMFPTARDKRSTAKDVTCYNCNRTGHFKSDCWAKGGKEGQRPGGQGRRGGGNNTKPAANTAAAAPPPPPANFAFATAVSVPHARAQPQALAQCGAIIDSGTTSHFCPDRTRFITFTAIEPQDVRTADGTCISALGCGDVEIELPLGEARTTVTLRNALHTPKMALTLISTHCIAAAGFAVNFESHNCNILSPAPECKLIASIPQVNGLYTIAAPAQERANVAKLTVCELHRVLGHVVQGAVLHTVKEGLVEGVVLDAASAPEFCDTCTMAKAARQPFPEETKNRARAYGELIHTDLWGPVQVESVTGHLYYMSFTDDFSCKSQLDFLALKSEALSAFKRYEANLMRQHPGTKIRKLRSDRGGEYLSAEFDTYLQGQGIKRQLTVHNSPQQNGVAECLNRTLVEHACTMLIGRERPKFLWAEAVNYATWLKNCFPSRAIPGTMPYALVNKSKPSLALAHKFGAKVFVHTTTGRKLEVQASAAIFVGVDDESKGYRIWWAEKRRVSIERNVTFPPAQAPIVTVDDALDEGEYSAPSDAQNAPEAQPTQNIVQPVAPQPPAPATPPRPAAPLPTPIALRATRVRPPAGYYRALNEGERAMSAATDASVDDDPDQVHWALATAEPELTLKEALSGPDGEEWQAAIDYEIGQLEKLSAWKIVNHPPRTNIIPCHFILATKRGPDGEKLKLRARLVANGQRQKHGLDYSETFVPTTNMTTICTVLTIAAHRDWEIHQIDIKSAYLNAELKDTIYLRAPPGYLKAEDEGKVLLLLRSLYGLKQAGFEWSEELEKFFLDAGFMCSQVDQAVYFRCKAEEHTVITVSVDDMAVTSQHLKHIMRFKAQLRERFEVSDLGELTWLLGLKVECDRKQRYGNLGACAKLSDPRGFQRLYNQPKNSPSNAREISLSLGAL
jgi:hypothetical protein